MSSKIQTHNYTSILTHWQTLLGDDNDAAIAIAIESAIKDLGALGLKLAVYTQHGVLQGQNPDMWTLQESLRADNLTFNPADDVEVQKSLTGKTRATWHTLRNWLDLARVELRKQSTPLSSQWIKTEIDSRYNEITSGMPDDKNNKQIFETLRKNIESKVRNDAKREPDLALLQLHALACAIAYKFDSAFNKPQIWDYLGEFCNGYFARIVESHGVKLHRLGVGDYAHTIMPESYRAKQVKQVKQDEKFATAANKVLSK